ncbi:MAG: DUF262 domain-containing protein [Acidobacteriota bacterium]|nr:DUF262 domain-containing protein [Acidobacteriota bacterium]
MKDAQKPDHISLNALVERLKEGRFVIPDFQRDFEWRPWDIKELMRSIFLDYYIGSLLLWKGKKENFDALSCEIIYGFKDKTGQQAWNCGFGEPEHIVLDGQQRLTALYYAFVAPNVPLPKRANRAVFFVNVEKFINEEYDVAFHYEWLSRRLAKILGSPEAQYAEHLFPLSIVGTGGWALANWAQGYENYWKEARMQAERNGDVSALEKAKLNEQNAKSFSIHLKGITEQYQISYIELDKDLAVDKVCDIFTQINSKGIRLDVFDLMNALLKPKGLQLKLMWRKAAPRLEFVDSGKMNVYVLQIMSILCQSYCSPKYLYYLLPGQEKQIRDDDGKIRKEILISDIKEFQKKWSHAVNSLEDSINMLKHPHEFGVSSSQYLPYVSILPVFAALQAACKDLPANQQLNAQRKIRHWYWASVFINRYSGSVESTSARDFIDIRAWMDDEDATPALLHEFHDRFRSLELKKETKKGTSVYNGIFNLLVIQGARDWMTGNVPQYGDLDDHHIVPISRATDLLKGIAVHTILNRTPLTAETNRKIIRNRLPNEYLPDLIADNSETQVRAILESHFISSFAMDILLRDPFGPDDYDAFITERQRTILEAVENLLIKERLDLSPSLRELDQNVEKTELDLRKCIIDTLGNEPGRLPQHIAQKIYEKIQKAAKKNAAIDLENYHALKAKLEFADLRDLQEIITSQVTWHEFQSRFANKETLNIKFDQLAELRNSIRHSRAVDDVKRKEGEAAILWFRQVLNK